MQYKSKVVFKEYIVNQQQLLPPSLEDLIPANHLVKVVEKVLNEIDISALYSRYRGGGASSYHPLMMLKVITYGFSQKIYSCRKLAKAVREQIPFMWIAGMNTPDFRTINRFISDHLQDTIEPIFASLVELLAKEGRINLENYFLDGTKIESNANKYSWVWKKATEKFHQRLREEVKKMMEEVKSINAEENLKYQDHDLEEKGDDNPINSQNLLDLADDISRQLEQTPENKDLKKAVKKISKDYLPRMEKYEEQEKHFNGRNSYSKTDHDATFMRMKEDHMKNGQLKPGYNVQIGTENQFIVGFSLHQKPTDTTTLIPHLEKLKKQLGYFPKNIVADAGYGSEENYLFLEQEELGNYVKFNYFHAEQKRKFKKNAFRVENLTYDKESDFYVCPNGKKLTFQFEKTYITDNKFKTTRRMYKCESCSDCSLRTQCHTGKDDRWIRVSLKLNELKQKVRDNLNSDDGVRLRSLRPIEPESVFGQIKHNRSFKRFHRRGISKVNVEWGLLAISHNLMKIAA